jgi:hypothetical protein
MSHIFVVASREEGREEPTAEESETEGGNIIERRHSR